MKPQSRDDGGYWLAVHTGLLDDEEFVALSPTRKGAFLVLFLQAYREPDKGWFRDFHRGVWLLTRQGWAKRDAEQALVDLFALRWLEPESEDGVRFRVRNWHEYQRKGKKAVHNQERGDRTKEYARRPSTRAGRKAQSVTEPVRSRDGATRRDAAPSGRRGAPAREERGGPPDEPTKYDPPKEDAKSLLQKYGYEPPTRKTS